VPPGCKIKPESLKFASPLGIACGRLQSMRIASLSLSGSVSHTRPPEPNFVFWRSPSAALARTALSRQGMHRHGMALVACQMAVVGFPFGQTDCKLWYGRQSALSCMQRSLLHSSKRSFQPAGFWSEKVFISC